MNGEKSKCWPQELLIVKLDDDGNGYSLQDEIPYKDFFDDISTFKNIIISKIGIIFIVFYFILSHIMYISLNKWSHS